MGYYKTIRGKRYDRELLELASELTEGRGDGRISKADAQRLLEAVQDANSYTKIEKETISYIRKNYTFTKEADALFRKEIRRWAAAKSKSRGASGKKKSGRKKKTASAKKISGPVSFSKNEPSASAPDQEALEVSEAPPVPRKRKLQFLLLFLLVLAMLCFLIWKIYDSSKAYSQGLARKSTTQQSEHSDLQSRNTGFSSKSKIEKMQILFSKNERSPVSPDAKATLQDLAAILKKNPAMRIEIQGHTSAEDRTGANQRISEQRAKWVEQKLLPFGVNPKQLRIRGYAASRPAASNETKEGRRKNRRVVFQVLSD